MKKILTLILAAVMLFSCVSVCAAEEENIMYGDANSDKHVRMDDVTAILKYIAGWDMSKQGCIFNEKAADVTQDGNVNMKDVTKLLQYLAGWGYTLG